MKECKFCGEGGFDWCNMGENDMDPKWRLGNYGPNGFVVHNCKKPKTKKKTKKAKLDEFVTLEDGTMMNTKTGEIVENNLLF